jgi:hypothetical protein
MKLLKSFLCFCLFCFATITFAEEAAKEVPAEAAVMEEEVEAVAESTEEMEEAVVEETAESS